MILKLLLSGDKYGYEISKLIYARSGNQYELKEATMYSSLKRLEKEGSIASYWGDATQGGRRRYYTITEMGKETYKQNKENWKQAKQILEDLL
ncbi:PadR family transcriptional regulator [Virgibacillus saliphilus]|uniref:PadR family transcriptional regulator n=1 Tax=Virgibacillus saliphilus TaxID=2831674 RepID=UPI002106FAF9